MRQPPTWDDYFTAIAEAVARRSKDPRTQVGCVVVGEGRRVLATGYNGFPPGIEETSERWERQAKKRFVVHAEMNAVLHAKEDLNGATAYVTLLPCLECARALISKGIKVVVFRDYKEAGDQAWELMNEAGLEVRQVKT